MSRKGLAGALVGGVGVLLVGGSGLSFTVARYVPKVRPNTYVGEAPVGGLTRAAAMAQAEAWFKKASSKKLTLVSGDLITQPTVSAAELGARIDKAKTLARLPMDDFWTGVKRMAAKEQTPKSTVLPIYDFDPKKMEQLADFIDANMKKGNPARAFLKGGKIVRIPEEPGRKLDEPKLSDTVNRAMLTGRPQNLAMVTAPKKVPDAALNSIQKVEAQYSTRFNAGQSERSSNIRLAARIIDGLVLMPGEKFSFNGRVGRRTSAGGFKTAGVFVNGRKDYDIGGGICQVSTTLYNAALLADLKVVRRSSHSRPVPYVPLGRDAAVSYPYPDLAFVNTLKRPVALGAQVEKGRITFRILGSLRPDEKISIVAGRITVKDNGVKYVQDDTLPFGVEKVIEAGSSRRILDTFRVVTKDGVEVKREKLFQSFYSGSPRIIARNAKAKAPAPGLMPPAPAGSQTAKPPHHRPEAPVDDPAGGQI